MRPLIDDGPCFAAPASSRLTGILSPNSPLMYFPSSAASDTIRITLAAFKAAMGSGTDDNGVD